MGFHMINGSLLDGAVDAAQPEALVYAPDKKGKLRLVALEYVVFAEAWTGEDPPSLFGEDFMFTAAPNRYEIPAFWALHAWIWQGNPPARSRRSTRPSAADRATADHGPPLQGGPFAFPRASGRGTDLLRRRITDVRVARQS